MLEATGTTCSLLIGRSLRTPPAPSRKYAHSLHEFTVRLGLGRNGRSHKGVRVDTQPQIFTSYYSSDGDDWQDQYAEITPVAGQFIWRGTGGGYQAYKVAEVWTIHEKHGRINHGLSVFVDPVDVMKTRLGKHAPDYYGGTKP